MLLAKEEYKLDVNSDGVLISYSTEEGRFRALSTLYQLIMSEGEQLSYISILDKPDFERRGYMLDISRHRMPKIETIKQLVDILAILKYNEFQLYRKIRCHSF